MCRCAIKSRWTRRHYSTSRADGGAPRGLKRACRDAPASRPEVPRLAAGSKVSRSRTPRRGARRFTVRDDIGPEPGRSRGPRSARGTRGGRRSSKCAQARPATCTPSSPPLCRQAAAAIGRERGRPSRRSLLWQTVCGAVLELPASCSKAIRSSPASRRSCKRGLHVGKQLVIVHGLARRVPPSSLAGAARVLPAGGDARLRGDRRNPDATTPNAVGMSCYSTYCHAILLLRWPILRDDGAPDELADRWLAAVGARCSRTRSSARPRPVIVVDLDGSSPGTLRREPRRPRRARRCDSAILASSRPACGHALKRLAAARRPSSARQRSDARAVRRAAVASGRHWYQAQRRDDSAHAAIDARGGGVRARTSVSPAGPSTGGPARAAVVRELRSTSRRWARSPTTTATEDAERRWPWGAALGTLRWRARRT